MINIKNLYKSFPVTGLENRLEVINNLNYDINKGDLLAITGPSGAGKTTLMNIIGGLDKPTSGQVLYNNTDIYSLSSQQLDNYRNSTIGFVFQFHYLLDDFTALENVMVPALIKGINQTDARNKAKQLLEIVGLTARLSHFPKEMSGGEQQRVAIARALINNPSIILADEPTGNLDRANSNIIQDILFQLKDIAVIIVTHDMDIASKCTRVLHLEKF